MDAPLEVTIPRKLLRVDRIAADKVKLVNSSRVALRLDGGQPLDPGAARDVWLPATITIGGKTLTLHGAAAPEPKADELQSLAASPPGPAASLLMTPAARYQISDGQMETESLLQWMQAALGVLQSAAGTTDFFRRAAGALVDLVGLDFGCVLLRENERWVVHTEGRAGHTGT